MRFTNVMRSFLALGLCTVLNLSCESAGGRVHAAEDDGVVLVKDGVINVEVILTEELSSRNEGRYAADGDTPYSELAVDELREHLGMIGAGELVVHTKPAAEIMLFLREITDEGRAVILIGTQELDWELAEAVVDAHPESAQIVPDREAFGLEVGDDIVKVVGLSPKATLNGVCEVLEQMGFRWYMPGDFGRIVPAGESHGIPEQRSLEVPSFPGRQISGSAMGTEWNSVWLRRMRNSIWDVRAGHGIHLKSFSPDYFRLRDGERARGQLCLTNSADNPEDPEENEVLAQAVEAALEAYRENPDRDFYGMGPNDGAGFCECDQCTALDSGNINPFSGRVDVTDRYIWFYNQVLKQIEDEFPNARIATLLYADQMMPPAVVKPDPRIWGRFAGIHFCRIHGPRNPVCPEGHSYRTITEGWAKLGTPIFNSGYWFNLATPGLPFMMMHRIRDEIPFAHELGHLGFSRRPAAHWATEGPSLYLAAKMMWNHELDVDALLDEFFSKFYGPAAEPMERYTMLLDEALRDGDHHAGRGRALLAIYDDENLKASIREALSDAERLAGDDMYGLRVQAAAQGWEYYEAYEQMIRSRKRHDYVRSMAAAERARELIGILTGEIGDEYDIGLLRVRPWRTHSAQGFFNRIVGHASLTDDVYPRVTGRNELVVGLDETWDFFQDNQGLGETMGLYRENITGGNFRPINTSVTWSDEGMRYYFGTAWYRQRFEVPATAAEHDRLMLWFAIADRHAQVWINGVKVGSNSGVRPFALEVTDALRFGDENVIAVQVDRPTTFELGIGGLAGPVMIYAEAEEVDEEDIDRERYQEELHRIRERGW